MIQKIWTIFALCGALAFSACTQNSETSAAASPKPAAQVAPAERPKAADAVKAPEQEAAPAVSMAAPEPPLPAIVIPPAPKPGVPHGPGFDMPLLELGGYAPPRPMDILKDAHIFAADHPEVAS